MSIFERVGDLIKSNVNDLLDRAEDPEKMVKQMVVDMEKQFQKATQELGTATGGLNRLKKPKNSLRTGIQKQKPVCLRVMKNLRNVLLKIKSCRTSL